MKGKLNVAEVNCEEHAAICKKAGVAGYPMLTYFGGKGAGDTEYTGGRKLEQMLAFSDKVSGPYVVASFGGVRGGLTQEIVAVGRRSSSLRTSSSA